MNNKPRPNLDLNKKYLDEVSGLMDRKGGEELEEIHFEYLTETLSLFGYEEDVYGLYLKESGGEEIKKLAKDIFEKINNKNLSEDELNKLHRLWDYLSEEDPLEKADLIYVFGGISKLAVMEAIRIKREGFAPKIMFSGKRASYVKDIEVTEAEQYSAMAIENGVPEKDILIEKESINTPENIVKSAEILKSLDLIPKSVIAVSLPYHTKRASLTMKSGFDWDFKLIRHPGKSAKYSRETYFKEENGWTYIFFEYLKLYGARQMGHF